MLLGVDTHFSQGWNVSLFGQAQVLGTSAIRDGISWTEIEKAPGVYDFSGPKTSWIATALAQGAQITLVFSGGGNPLYDGGSTVYTDAGRAAFANFVAAVVKQFPGIAQVEIGNEYNGNSFVTGPIVSGATSLRDDYYTAMLTAVDAKVDALGLGTKIVGGAAHSIPVAWFTDLKADGALAHMDAIAIHPYTTPPEEFGAQLAILRDVVGDKPIQATEFSSTFANDGEAASYLAKMVSVMGAAKVDQAYWFQLAKESWFPNMNLYDQTTSQVTASGKAFAFMDALLERGEVKQVAAGDMTYVYTFGANAAVIWGEARSITLAPGEQVYDIQGNLITNFSGRIDPNTPIVVIGANPITLGGTVTFGASNLIGDSYHQFDLTNPVLGSTAGFEGPWSYYALGSTGALTALQTMGGGRLSGEAWTPYIGSPYLRPLSVSATAINPTTTGVVERYTASAAGVLKIVGHWDVSESTTDGVTLTVKLNGTVLNSTVIYNPANGNVYDLTLSGIQVAKGDTIDFIIGANVKTGGDTTERHIQIFDETPAPVAPTLSVVAAVAAIAAPAPVVLNPVTVKASTNGTAAGDLIDGSAWTTALKLYGLDGNDTLIGGSGKDRLDGGAGADIMKGGAGDDTYYVDHVGDQVSELAGGGTDTVYSTVSFTLGAEVEKLFLTGDAAIDGYGNELANKISGSEGANHIEGAAGNDELLGNGGNDVLYGGDGNDTLNGGTGADVMYGGAGDDTYTVDDLGDKVIEYANEGTDTVLSSVSFTLGANVEKLTLTGTAAIDGTGNELANTIKGNDADNHLYGGAGNDTISGGGGGDWIFGGTGKDTLTGGAGADRFVFNSAPEGDTITDFVQGTDKIVIDHTAFAAIHSSLGDLNPAEFVVGAKALTADQHFVYNQATSSLYYDPDGSGAAAQTLLAKLSGAPALDVHDFVVI